MKPSHGFLGGLAAGVALDMHSLYLFGAGVLLGSGLVLAWDRLAGLARWAGRRLDRTGSTKIW